MAKIEEEKSPTRIFVVEDHKNFRNLLCISIDMKAGMEACGSAASGQEALQIIPDVNPDLVLIDLSMPKMSGLELLDKIREQWPDLKCLILSGHAEASYVKKAKQHGANGYILKARPREILDAIAGSEGKEAFVRPQNIQW